jgi:hypothetical protein
VSHKRPFLRQCVETTTNERCNVDHVFHLTRAMWKAVLGLHYKRREQKKSGQLAIF